MFSASGEFIGLVARASTHGLNTATILDWLGLPGYKAFQPTAEIVPASVVSSLASCLDTTVTQRCLQAQIDLFNSQVDYILGAPGKTKARFRDIMDLTERFQADLRAQLSIAPDTALSRSLKTVLDVRLLQHGSQDRFEALKRISDDSIARFCAVSVIADLAKTQKTMKDFVAAGAYFYVCSEMRSDKSSDEMLSKWKNLFKKEL